MKNKLKSRAQKSKLQEVNNQEKTFHEKVVTINNQNSTSNLRGFHLNKRADNYLQEMLIEVNSHSSKKIGTSRLIEALIYLGRQTDKEKLIKALKESSF